MAQRVGRIDAGVLRSAVRAIDRLYTELQIVGLDSDLSRLAGDLAERHGLRGYDAVHLATAVAIGDPELLVATWDQDLSAAVTACGYAAIPA
jgi:hypothetical protein